MKLKNWLLISSSGAVGYVLGTRAGRERFEELKARANSFLSSPTVQDSVATVANRVGESADKLPGPAGGLVKGAADQLKNAVGTPSGTTPDSSADIDSDASPVDLTFDAPADLSFDTPADPAFGTPVDPPFDAPTDPAFGSPLEPTFDTPVDETFSASTDPTLDPSVDETLGSPRRADEPGF